MRKGFVFDTARAAAFASLGIWAGVLPVQFAGAAPLPNGHDIGDTSQDVNDQAPLLAFLTAFWDAAWGAEFSPNDSGMGLESTTMPGSWSVTAYQQNQPVGTGSYDEILRIGVPGPWNSELPPGGPAVFDLYVSAGTFHGLGDYSAPTWGLVHHVEITGDGQEPLFVEGFTPLGTAVDLAIAVAIASDLVASFTQLWTQAAGDPPPFTVDPCSCIAINTNERAACFSDAISCELLCTSIALGAIAGCLATGPFVAPCMIIVLAAHALCVANCIAAQDACLLRAENHFLQCLQSCPQSITR